jgi:segregation and condensation protein B
LLELGLVEIAGRADSVGRPLLYQTTPEFMDKFGLASLDNLPTLREIDELLDDPAYNRERAQLLFREGLGLESSDDEITIDHPRESARRSDVTELANDVSSPGFDVEGDGAVGSDDGYILGGGGPPPPERG